jgi:hypothetical protein
VTYYILNVRILNIKKQTNDAVITEGIILLAVRELQRE